MFQAWNRTVAQQMEHFVGFYERTLASWVSDASPITEMDSPELTKEEASLLSAPPVVSTRSYLLP